MNTYVIKCWECHKVTDIVCVRDEINHISYVDCPICKGTITSGHRWIMDGEFPCVDEQEIF